MMWRDYVSRQGPPQKVDFRAFFFDWEKYISHNPLAWHLANPGYDSFVTWPRESSCLWLQRNNSSTTIHGKIALCGWVWGFYHRTVIRRILKCTLIIDTRGLCLPLSRITPYSRGRDAVVCRPLLFPGTAPPLHLPERLSWQSLVDRVPLRSTLPFSTFSATVMAHAHLHESCRNCEST